MGAFLYAKQINRCRSPPVLTSFRIYRLFVYFRANNPNTVTLNVAK